MSLETLQKKIQKAVKGIHCETLSNSDIAKCNCWVSTPAYDLNRILSGDLFKGLREGSMNFITGAEATFKSSFATLCGSNAQKDGFKVIYIDTEGGITDEFVIRWGLNPDNILYIYEPIVENVSAIMSQILDEQDDERYFIILDSIGGLESTKLVNDSLSGDVKQDQGGLARKIKQMMKIFTAAVKKTKSIGVYSGHMYGSPGMFSTEEIGGGKAPKYLADIIIMLRKTKKQDKDKNIIGNLIKSQTIKNRFYPAFNQCEVDIDYIKGVNKLHGMVELAVEFGFIEKSGAGWYTNIETNEKIQGADKVSSWITDDMLNKINEKIKATGYSTINEKLAEEIGEIV